MENRTTGGAISLGDFLRSRRARTSPEDVGLTSYGNRRVPGLRREELAQLAGVSAAYYTRLEQGQSSNASESVIEALVRALRLSEDERAHLHDLARPHPAKRQVSAPPDVARSGIKQLIAAMPDIPAVVLGRRNEVLAWNPLAHALLAGHYDIGAPDRPDDRPNIARMLFLDPHTRGLYRRWDQEATRMVSALRLIAGRYPDDVDLAALIGELSVKSHEFAALWSERPVQTCVSGTKYLHHPEVGECDLDFEVLHLPEDIGHRIITYTAGPATASAAALRLLQASIQPSCPRGGVRWI